MSLRIDAGEFVALIGQNGAGKTTTLAKHFNGLLKPTAAACGDGARHALGVCRRPGAECDDGCILAECPTRQVLSDAALLRRAYLRPPQVTRVAQRLADLKVAPDTTTVAELCSQIDAALGSGAHAS